MNANELCIPAGAVALAEEGGGQAVPAAGDEIEVMVRGPVTRSEGDKIYFTANTANGQPIPSSGPEGLPAGGMEDEGAALGQDISKMERGYL